MSNTKVVVKIGETVTLSATLQDTDEATNQLKSLDLTGYQSVKMTAKKGSTVIINDRSCTILPNQDTTNTGKVTCTFTATVANFPNLVKGKCELEFKATDAAGGLHYFPKREDPIRTYGSLTFQNPLS
jgi:hypothetical protein